MLGVEIAAAVSLVVHCGPATPAGSAVPDISPDGLEVAYTIPREESAEIEVARPGTVSPRTRWLTLDSAPEKLVWSARGRVLAFQKRTGAIEVLSFGRPPGHQPRARPRRAGHDDGARRLGTGRPAAGLRTRRAHPHTRRRDRR